MRYLFKIVCFFSFLMGLVQANGQANSVLNTADSLFQLGYFQQSETIYTNYLSVSSEKPLVVQHQLAECRIRLGNTQQALPELEILLKTVHNHPKPDRLLEAKIANSIGQCQLAMGMNDDAGESFQSALTLLPFHVHKSQGILYDQPDVLAEVYSSLGLWNWYNGNEEQAEELHQKARSLREKTFGKTSLQTASSLNDLGLTSVNTDPDKAIEYYQQALTIYQKYYPEQHPKIAYSYNNLAIAFRKKREYVKAMDYLRKVEAIQTAIYPNDHPSRAFLSWNMAQVYSERGQKEIALTHYQGAVDTYRNLYGDKHPELANIYNELAQLSLKDKDYTNALNYYQKALIANTILFTSSNIYSNPSASDFLNPNILLTTLVMKARALEQRYTYKTLLDKELKTALLTLEAGDTLIQQLRQLKTNKNDKLELGALASTLYQTAVRIAMTLADKTLNARLYQEKAFYFSEKNKAAVLSEALSDTKAKHFANIPDSYLIKEKNLKTEVAFCEQKLAESKAKEELEMWRDKRFAANITYESFVKSLEREFPAYYQLKYSTKMPSVKEIQLRVPGQTALITYLIADSSHRIYTFVLTQKQFKVYDNPLSPQFEKWIRGYRNAILFKSEEEFVYTSNKLYKQLWPQSLASEIKDIVLIPDSKTGSIPFEAFSKSDKVGEEDSYASCAFLVEKYAFTYAFSAQLWYASGQQTSSSTKSMTALLFAPVSFNSLPYLSGSEAEVEGLDSLFRSKSYSASSFLFGNATESVLKSSLLGNYRYIHLATHGKVNTTKPELSAVYLNDDSTQKEDGVLYSGEIYNLNIKADLVTLSACETGLGKVSSGEGIIGLTRALLYAGAARTLVSLWTVSDQSTRSLMQYFYKGWLNDTSPNYAGALANAKRQLIQNKTYRAPYYWAAFVLIGQ